MSLNPDSTPAIQAGENPPAPQSAPGDPGQFAAPQSEWFLADADQTIAYRSPEAAIAGIRAKDEFIERQKAELAEAKAHLRMIAQQQMASQQPLPPQRPAESAQMYKDRLVGMGLDPEFAAQFDGILGEISKSAREEARRELQHVNQAREQIELQQLASAGPQYTLQDPFFAQVYYANSWMSPRECAIASDNLRAQYLHYYTGNSPAGAPASGPARPPVSPGAGRFQPPQFPQINGQTPGPTASNQRVGENDPRVQAAMDQWARTYPGEANNPTARAAALKDAIEAYSR